MWGCKIMTNLYYSTSLLDCLIGIYRFYIERSIFYIVYCDTRLISLFHLYHYSILYVCSTHYVLCINSTLNHTLNQFQIIILFEITTCRRGVIMLHKTCTLQATTTKSEFGSVSRRDLK